MHSGDYYAGAALSVRGISGINALWWGGQAKPPMWHKSAEEIVKRAAGAIRFECGTFGRGTPFEGGERRLEKIPARHRSSLPSPEACGCEAIERQTQNDDHHFGIPEKRRFPTTARTAPIRKLSILRNFRMNPIPTGPFGAWQVAGRERGRPSAVTGAIIPPCRFDRREKVENFFHSDA